MTSILHWSQIISTSWQQSHNKMVRADEHGPKKDVNANEWFPSMDWTVPLRNVDFSAHCDLSLCQPYHLGPFAGLYWQSWMPWGLSPHPSPKRKWPLSTVQNPWEFQASTELISLLEVLKFFSEMFSNRKLCRPNLRLKKLKPGLWACFWAALKSYWIK